uniref:Uncharacterized protein n=1 Tax=Desertifilum tharense IPPAS B-1220 TaxID=1781255 RepID=A0ACD5GZT6_9CYAN
MQNLREMNRQFWRRDRLVIALAFLFLLRGSISSWYRLPQIPLAAFSIQSMSLEVGRILALGSAIACFFLIFKSLNLHRFRLGFYAGLVIVLLFPFWINLTLPNVSLLAATYADQDYRVSRYVEEKIPEIQSQWKQNILLARSVPIRSVFGLKIEDSRFFQMSSWDKVWLEGFGYHNAFFTFIGKGWSVTSGGLVLAIIGLYLAEEPNQRTPAFLQDWWRILPGVSLILATLLFYLLSINLLNHRLDTLFAQGAYRPVIELSRSLTQWYPPVQGDEAFLKRWGEASYYSGEPDTSLVAFVKGLERDRLGDFAQSAAYYQQALNLNPQQFLIREYLATALINQGVDYFKDSDRPQLPKRPTTSSFPYKSDFLDSPQAVEQPNITRPAGAIQHFEEALSVFPGHLEALYDLMLARAVNGEFSASADAAQQIIQLQKSFQQPNAALLGQAYLHLTWADYHQGDFNRAWRRYRQSTDPKTWKQPIEESP